MEAAVASSNEFNLKLLQAYRNDRQQGNIFYSPFSITSALAMLYRGARRETEEEMENVLCIGESDPIHEGFRDLLKCLRQLSGNAVLDIANILAVDKSYKILEEYSSGLKENYDTDYKVFDFKYNPKTAQKDLNQTIKYVTKGKIKDLFTPDSINSDTKLVLANAVYFKGTWKEKFDKRRTQKKPFYTRTNEEVVVDMMYKNDDYNYFESPDLKASFLEIPYLGNKLSMIVVLPNERDGLMFLEKNITVEKIKHSFQNMSSHETDLYFPRFKLEESLPLKECLSAMGMKEAFTPNADLSGISGRRELFVSDALHKAFVEVNEEGTEAAAATGLGEMFCCYVPPVSFTVDHPFMFFIWEVDSGLILFTGSVHSL